MASVPLKIEGRNSKPWRRRPLWICALVLIPVLLALFAYFSSHYAGDKRLQEAIAEADRLDPDWRLADLEAKQLPFPDPAKNGIDQVVRIRNASPPRAWPEWPFTQFDNDPTYLKEVRKAMDSSLVGDRMAPTLLNAEQERVLRAELTRNAASIEQARRLPEYPYGRFPVRWSKDYFSTVFTHRMFARWVGNLMTYDARLCAHEGDVTGAFQDVKATIYASRAIGVEPTLQSQLVRIQCDTIADQILEKSLACGRGSEKELLDLQKVLEQEAQTPFFLTGIRGERACLDAVMERIQNGEFTIGEYWRFMTDGGTFFPWGRVAPVGAAFFLKTVTTYLNVRNERAELLHLINEFVEFGKLPAEEMAKSISAKEKVWIQQYPFKDNLVYESSRYVMADLRAKAILRTAYTGLAMERFHLAKGHWPNTLQELVPSYLSAVPLDPFDGAPLRLVRKGSAVIVYSVSNDLVDDGGVLLIDPTSKGSDIGFVLHDPNQRRQPAKPFEFPKRLTPPDSGSEVSKP